MLIAWFALTAGHCWLLTLIALIDSFRPQDHQCFVIMSLSASKRTIQNVTAIVCQGCGTTFLMLLYQLLICFCLFWQWVVIDQGGFVLVQWYRTTSLLYSRLIVSCYKFKFIQPRKYIFSLRSVKPWRLHQLKYFLHTGTSSRDLLYTLKFSLIASKISLKSK